MQEDVDAETLLSCWLMDKNPDIWPDTMMCLYGPGAWKLPRENNKTNSTLCHRLPAAGKGNSLPGQTD
jgi:hypothetical protein